MPVISEQLKPIDTVNGFQICPGFFREFGAVAIPGGVNFTIHTHGATSCELLLFHRKAEEPYAVIPFPESYRIGFCYSMIVFDLDIEEFEYAYRLDGPYDEKKGLRFDKNKILLDPYARAVTGQSQWGHVNNAQHGYRARVVQSNFDWGDQRHHSIPMEDLIIYELHVRGFTMDESSGVKHHGTFEGLREKISYLKELGVNAVELMPIFEFDEMRDVRLIDENELIDFWGYNPVSFFAPNTSYCSSMEYNREGLELKTLIKDLHDNGIEVILDVVFNHTAEGNEFGPCFSFKGFDNNIYYMLTPDGHYYNFSGCGNTLNCNHPVVRDMILECLRYWVIEYRVDGFRFDLASILGRNDDGTPLSQPPLLRSLAFDSILGNVKLIAEAWDAGGLYQVGSFPSWKRWAEWNGRYRDDMRRFLKGDDFLAQTAAARITGSPDLYDPAYRGGNASINFLTCHDGFTLYDLYSYNQKHNEANGWGNTDGADDNNSWNCGVEGETDDPAILALRKRLMKNACAILLCSRGTPMFLSGDEFADTRYGNNNPYCQDNLISWLDWSLLKKNKDLFDFFQYMIQFRKNHPVIRKDLEPSYLGVPAMSTHGLTPDETNFSGDSHVVCVRFAGYNEATQKEDLVYLAVNSGWFPVTLTLPELPEHYKWKVAVNTGDPKCQFFHKNSMPTVESKIFLGERSVIIFVATAI
ncbi:glycogen debranching protein GlgX [[Ruminococcus] torques]|uniref:glycogen debranching protein GlgX n=1 Tax=[Ruminococcus] torques TaxID=33039 RepID=UPI0006C3AD5A|nr:glycogen debranching protein GlgX [[Ruminococcus] torques]CUQ68769.1 Glycogen debranching enzyme [[Ruminococcus] torques]